MTDTRYWATRSFAVGSSGVMINERDEVHFDGSRFHHMGREFVCPGLRGAIKVGWLREFPTSWARILDDA